MYLIVGATGSLGGQVAKALLARGERVRAVCRPESPMRQANRHTDPDELRRLGAEVVAADLTRPETLVPALRGVHSVLMTASGTKRMPPDTVEAVDVAGSAALAQAAKQAGVGHFVYASVRGVSPDVPGIHAAKWAAENAIRATGVPATFVRSAMFMDDWIGFVLGAQLQGGPRVQLVGEADPARPFADEADVAKLVTEALLAGPPDGAEPARTVEFASDAASYGEIVERMAKASGMPLKVERLPVGQAVTTVPEPLAGAITYLLTLLTSIPEDGETTPEAWERYAFVPQRIDDYLPRMFAAARKGEAG